MSKTKTCRIVNTVNDLCYLQIDDDVEGTFQFCITEDEIELIEKACKVYGNMMRKRDLPKRMVEYLKKENGQLEKRKERYKTLTENEIIEIGMKHCRLCGTQRCMGIDNPEYGEVCSAIDEYIIENET